MRHILLMGWYAVFLLAAAFADGLGLAQQTGQQEQTSAVVVQQQGDVQKVGVDPNGTWLWEQQFGGRSRQRSVTLSFADGKLTGTYGAANAGSSGGPPGFNDPVQITNGSLAGDRIRFEVTRRFGPNEFTTIYAGVVSEDQIAGMSSVEFGGRVREAAWMAARSTDVAEIPESDVQESEEDEASQGADDRTQKSPAKENAEPVRSDQADVGLEIYEPMRIPSPGDTTATAYVPQAILPGGIVVPLYPPSSPHLDAERIKEPETYSLSNKVHGRINSIVNIHNPSIEIHFANPSMNTGSVVILAAGGGHRTLNVGTESADFVPFFYNYGVNTVILRNRLRSDGYEPTTDAVRDAQQAIRIVRKFSDRWGFDPKRIGIMGFSAGAELSARAATQFDSFDRENEDADDPLAGVSSRPDFVGIIYPGPTPFTRNPEAPIPKNTPPAFLTCAGAGDRIHAIWATDYLSAMLRAGIPNVEMHIYGNGFHPGTRGATGGLTHRAGIPFGTWQNRYMDWFEDLGFLEKPGTDTKAAKDSRQFASQASGGSARRRSGQTSRSRGQPR